MFKLSLSFLIIVLVALLGSCTTGKQLALFQDLNNEPGAKVQQVRTAAFDPLRLQTDDQLQVVISSISPEASQLFNLMGSAVITNNNNTQNMQSVYSVSPSGNITIPVVGDIMVAGLTTDEAKAQIKKAVSEYLKDAVVSATEAPQDSVRVIVNEVPRTHWGIGGVPKGGPQ